MHIILLTEGPVCQHEQFLKWVKSRKYKGEGKYRTGDITPYLSEVKLYDIRIKKEGKDRFLEDLSSQIGLIENKGNVKMHLGKTLNKLEWLVTKFTSLIKIESPKRNPKIKKEFDGWFYIKTIGGIEDRNNEEDEEWL